MRIGEHCGVGVVIKVKKPNENPFRLGSKKEIAWRIVRGYGGCPEEECIAALDKAGLARHGRGQMGNRGYLREFHRLGLINLPGYIYRGRHL
jgi:hypothetical protein